MKLLASTLATCCLMLAALLLAIPWSPCPVAVTTILPRSPVGTTTRAVELVDRASTPDEPPGPDVRIRSPALAERLGRELLLIVRGPDDGPLPGARFTYRVWKEPIPSVVGLIRSNDLVGARSAARSCREGTTMGQVLRIPVEVGEIIHVTVRAPTCAVQYWVAEVTPRTSDLRASLRLTSAPRTPMGRLEIDVGAGWSRPPLDSLKASALDLSWDVHARQGDMRKNPRESILLTMDLPPGRYRVFGALSKESPAERVDPFDVVVFPGCTSRHYLTLTRCGVVAITLQVPADSRDCSPFTVGVRDMDGRLAAKRVLKGTTKVVLDFLRQGVYTVEVYDICGRRDQVNVAVWSGSFAETWLQL